VEIPDPGCWAVMAYRLRRYLDAIIRQLIADG